MSFQDVEFEQIARQFRGLRTVQGHFSGGEWNRDVDAFDGTKHRVMKALAERIAARNNVVVADLRDELGEPDSIVRAVEDVALNKPALNEADAGNEPYYLVYYWRGPHDFLHFRIVDGRLTAVDWWQAGE